MQAKKRVGRLIYPLDGDESVVADALESRNAIVMEGAIHMLDEERLVPEGYKPRMIESRLDALMRAFGCVEINGPKWCGKTWTAMTRAASMTQLDDPQEREAAEMDPSIALAGKNPHLVDEWQEVPEVWDAVRRQVDATGNRRGQLLLTGSTVLPKEKRQSIRHSGAGRIARLSMAPMALCESGESSGSVSLKELFEGKPICPVRADTSLVDVARWCCRGGWPANLGLPDEVAIETANQYIGAVLDINVLEDGRSPDTALSLMRALAVNESQAVTYKTLSKDMAAGAAAPGTDTIAAYLELFDRMHLTQGLNGWEPPMRSKARVRVKPKRYFCDPSLPAALLGATPERLLQDMQTLGLLFENLVVRDLRTFLSTYPGLGNELRYYRDDNGLEVDAIAEHAGRWAGIEIKLSDTKADEAAESLRRLSRKVASNAAQKNGEPAFLAVVVGRGKLAYTRDDGVHVIPAAVLGP